MTEQSKELQSRIAKRSGRTARLGKRRSPVTTYEAGSTLAKEIEERLSNDAEFMLMMKPQ